MINLLESTAEEFGKQVESHVFSNVLQQIKSNRAQISLERQDNTIALNHMWRVSDDPIQWQLDRRKPCGTWEVLWFARTRDGLLRGINEKCGVIDPVALAAIGALPEFHRPGVLRGLSVGGIPPSPLDRNGPVAACQGPANAFPTTGVAVVLWPLHGGVYDVTLDGKKIVNRSPNPERDAAAALREFGFTGSFETIDSPVTPEIAAGLKLKDDIRAPWSPVRGITARPSRRACSLGTVISFSSASAGQPASATSQSKCISGRRSFAVHIR